MPNTKSKILDLIASATNPAQAIADVTDDNLIHLLNGMTSPLPLPKQAEGALMSQFLHAGAIRFDRWFAPSPYVVSPTQAERFKKFVKALWRSENFVPENCATLQLHVIRDQLFKELGERALSEIRAVQVQEYRKRICEVQAPSRLHKWEEFNEHRAAIQTILNGIADRSLRTHLGTRIPYLITKEATILKLRWQGLDMVIQLRPEYRSTEESMVEAGSGVIVSVGASRWQTGLTHVQIEVEALVDASAYTESMQAIQGHTSPIDGWPKAFTLGFTIIRDLVWDLRARHEGLQDWIPAPRDLADVEYFLKTSETSQLGYIRLGSPAALQQMFLVPAEPATLDVGELQPLSWFAECRLRANMYLELGDTNEALFWLNVSVEALILERFGKIEIMTEITGLTQDLGSPREFWAQAEEIISKQFPQMAGQVKWPSAPLHVSVFGKLKVLYRRVEMRTTLEDLLRRYRVISGNRNDLFHGKSTRRTSASDILNAMEALSWIDNHMWPRGDEVELTSSGEVSGPSRVPV